MDRANGSSSRGTYRGEAVNSAVNAGSISWTRCWGTRPGAPRKAGSSISCRLCECKTTTPGLKCPLCSWAAPTTRSRITVTAISDTDGPPSPTDSTDTCNHSRRRSLMTYVRMTTRASTCRACFGTSFTRHRSSISSIWVPKETKQLLRDKPLSNLLRT